MSETYQYAEHHTVDKSKCPYYDSEIGCCRKSEVPRIAIPLDVNLDEAIRNDEFKVIRFADVPEPKIENRWIPVTERLPEEYGRYLVTVDSKAIKEKLVAADDYFPYGWDDYRDDVVAWMPLPEPWKGEEE